MDVCFQEISHQEYYIISTMYLQSTAWTFKDIIFLMPYLALKILEAKWRLKYIFVLLLVYCSGKKKKYLRQLLSFHEKEKSKWHIWNEDVLTYLQWCIGEHNHHGKDKEPCMKMTAFVSPSHAVEFYSLTAFRRVEREGSADRE